MIALGAMVVIIAVLFVIALGLGGAGVLARQLGGGTDVGRQLDHERVGSFW